MKETYTIDSRLVETSENHSDMVDAFAYAIASREARLIDSYFLMHVRKKPRWVPERAYRWILSKLLVMNEFKTK